ncbi:hypothetical protein [Ornithinimicrobium avium]|uniref:Uncharacterized protein n=1 Tax=Ornithinimicrobium avium TaxID=2283195 RepID=A0A345NN33_9MICO|nr:hypothetical protein [Ornithinimicrobium avium]AXH96441.1 hypothetical protein DV701_10200 [Ornithinimicrobium avium]
MVDLEQRRQIMRTTYDYLRWLLVLLPALLFVVTVATSVQQGRLEPSISAYYGGPVRDVFVGCLVAIAALLVAYQGVGLLEDYTLNGAGFYAVFVAFVPSSFAGMMDELARGPGPDGLGVADHVWFLRITLTSVLVLCALLFAREIRVGNLPRLFRSDTGRRLADLVNRAFVVLTLGVLVAYLALVMRQLWLVPAADVRLPGLVLGPLRASVHDLAAIFMMCSLAVAVLTNTWPFYRFSHLRSAGRLAYLVIFVLMVAGPLVAWGLARVFAPGHVVILLEWWEIALFSVFWALETRRIMRVRSDSIVRVPDQGPLREPLRDPASTGDDRARA